MGWRELWWVGGSYGELEGVMVSWRELWWVGASYCGLKGDSRKLLRVAGSWRGISVVRSCKVL